jgi:hypothetical protein
MAAALDGPRQAMGTGAHAALYLSRFIYRVALTNHRIERFHHGHVTFRDTHARTGETRRLTLPVNTFIGRFSSTSSPEASPRSAPTASSAPAVESSANAPGISSSSTLAMPS